MRTLYLTYPASSRCKTTTAFDLASTKPSQPSQPQTIKQQTHSHAKPNHLSIQTPIINVNTPRVDEIPTQSADLFRNRAAPALSPQQERTAGVITYKPC